MFDWDEANIDHVQRHGVEPNEAEEALLAPDRVPYSGRTVPGERRYVAVGSTEAGRVLTVVYTRRGGGIRVITARPASPREARYHRNNRM